MTDQNIPPPIVMPHSRAAEESLLGAVLIDSESIARLTIEPEDFYLERNAMIYQAVTDLRRAGQEVDYLTVCARLDEQKRLAEIGGPAYIMQIINTTPSSSNAESYAEIVQTRAKRRRIIQTAQKLAGASFDMDSDLNGAVSAAMDALSKSVITQKGAKHISQYISSVYDEVYAAQSNPQDIYGIPTGLVDFDRITYGLQKGEKLVLSGEPGVGKSVLAAQFLIGAAECGHPGALYELEMSGNQVVRRSLANKSRVTTQKMRQGKMEDGEVIAFTHAVENMSALPIYLSEASDITTVEIRADLIRLIDNFGVEVVMIDYEGLLGDAPDKDDNARSKLISKRVHDIAKDLNVAVISINGMTKEGIKGNVKGQGAIAGTASALHDADQAVVLRKTDNENIVRLTWEKMREGEPDRFVDLVRAPGFPMFAGVQKINRGQ